MRTCRGINLLHGELERVEQLAGSQHALGPGQHHIRLALCVEGHLGQGDAEHLLELILHRLAKGQRQGLCERCGWPAIWCCCMQVGTWGEC